MKFDINETLDQMLAAIKGSVGENWPQVKATASQFLENKKERLNLLAELRIAGDLSHEKFMSRLEDEKLIAEAELNALKVLSKAMAQDAANAGISVLEKTVKGILDAVL